MTTEQGIEPTHTTATVMLLKIPRASTLQHLAHTLEMQVAVGRQIHAERLERILALLVTVVLPPITRANAAQIFVARTISMYMQTSIYGQSMERFIETEICKDSSTLNGFKGKQMDLLQEYLIQVKS